MNVTPVFSSPPSPISMEPRGKLKIPCDCGCSKGSGTVNKSLAFVVITPCNAVSESNEICIDDYKTMSHCIHILVMK